MRGKAVAEWLASKSPRIAAEFFSASLHRIRRSPPRRIAAEWFVSN
ncbi:hypothetical protein [Amycolatopsis sp. La24]|nr:hypothetical protein [Amycolatopsis sp. La24]